MIRKHEMNPIVRPFDVKPSMESYRVQGAFNPGATVFGDEVLLLLRVAEICEPKEGYIRIPTYRFDDGHPRPDIIEFKALDPDVKLRDTRSVVYKGREYLSTISHIRIARSKDGLHFTVDEKPLILPVDETEEYGVEDARVTFIDDKYYITYTAVSQDSWATALAVTEDFKSVERKGLVFYPENKDVVIFPEKVGGKYMALHRPNNSGFGKPSIWYSESPDMVHWGNHRCILRPRDTKWVRVGAGTPPIKTPEGWLVIAHGMDDKSAYSLFCVLLDLEEPRRVVRCADAPLLMPTEPYETDGFFGNVVFSNGMIEKDGKILVYYGAADESSCVAITDIDGLLAGF
ncbi:MAG: glycoside hydrolase family 130 protein [Ignavibacteriales bacterium]|nr:glycoside hydrolase family 130 protein [Ignavibacteriales bacterium]